MGSDGIVKGHRTGVRSVARSPIVRIVATGLAVALLLIGPLPGPLGIAADDGPTNPLDGPFVDVAILPETDPATTPDLLVLRASDGTSGQTGLSILRRGTVWEDESTIDIDLGASDLPDRWLVDLGTGRYAVIATSHDQPHRGHAAVVIMQVTEGQTPRIEETARQTFDRGIDSSGAADVDGFGSAELVLGMRPIFDPNGACGSTALDVIDGATAVVRRAIDLPPTIGSGVLGRFDDVPGEDLLLYLAPGCPPIGANQTSLVSVNLGDGRQLSMAPGTYPLEPTSFPAPLRLDLDGKAPDEALATVFNGLAVIDRQHGNPRILGDFLPLLASGSGLPGPGARVALYDTRVRDLVVGDLRRDRAGIQFLRRSAFATDDMDAARAQVVDTLIRAPTTIGDPPAAWSGEAVSKGCFDLVVPGAFLSCLGETFGPGPAWLATRPIAAVPVGDRREILIAAGLGWDGHVGLPRSPTPLATGLAGWWRRGPSVPFALSEIDSDQLGAYERYPAPDTTIGTTTASDGSTAVLSADGARLFTSIVPLSEGQEASAPAADVISALVPNDDVSGTRRDEVLRVPVPPGLVTGRDGSSVRLNLSSTRTATGPAGRWSVQVLPVNDWGEWGFAVSRVVTGDTVAPVIGVDVPFLSPIWPLSASLAGNTEPGSTVSVDGIGPVDVDTTGRFTITQVLAPWPQTIRVRSMDAAGNTTTGEFTVIGGVDYRTLPWPGIAAAVLLASIAIRGLFGGRRGSKGAVDTKPRSTGLDDPPLPEIEELPPGGGLARG